MFKYLKPKPQPTVKQFYEQHKDEILKIVSTEHLNRTTLKDLKYEITALSGKRYYSFPETLQLPFKRFAKGIELMDWWKNGIVPEEFDTIYEEMLKCWAHVKAKTDQADKMAERCGMLINELKKRRKQGMPYYVMINLAANYLVREDEDPQLISATIFHEKCDEIENEIEQGNNAFFLAIPQLRPLSEVQRLSPEELTEFLNQLQSQAIRETQVLKHLLSWTEQPKDKKTSSKV